MKRISFIILVTLIGLAHASLAQTTKNVVKKQTVKKSVQKKQIAESAIETVSLSSTTSNQAFATAPVRRFSIADPTINVLNQRANGSNVQVSSSGIVGMPKGTYGYANGKIFLRSTTATSSGTNYGSGAVGTGSTIMGLGAGESAIGVNGKSPYAGSWLWGSKLSNYNLPTSDSIGRRQ